MSAASNVASSHPHGGDPAVLIGRDAQDVAVGGEIVRHRLSSRVIHWVVAATFLISLFSGLPIWSSIFGWMATFFGGLAVCRWLHPWAGLVFGVASFVMYGHWAKEMVLLANEKDWLGPGMIRYLKYQGDDSQVGKYNGGQKLFFFAVSLGALGLLVSGIVLWLPMLFSSVHFPEWARILSILLHEITFVLFVVAIVWHVYLATAAEPGTFGAMMRGTVSKSWARLHHPRWYKDVTGDEP